MVFQLSLNSFTLNALKIDRIGAFSDLLLFLVEVLVQDLDYIHEITDFGLNMKHRLEQLTGRIWVVPVRSDYQVWTRFLLFSTLSNDLDKMTNHQKQPSVRRSGRPGRSAARSDCCPIGLPPDRLTLWSHT